MKGRERDQYRPSRISYIADAAFEYFQDILLSGTYLAKLTASMGMSDSLTGILSSIIALGGTFRIASVYLFRNPPYKKKVILFDGLSQLLTISLYLLPLTNLPAAVGIALFALLLILHHVGRNIAYPAMISWRMNLVDDQKRGRFTAIKEMISLISGVAFTYTMGSIIDRHEALGCPEESFRMGVLVLIGLTVVRLILMSVCREKPVEKGREKSGGSMGELLRMPVMRRLIGMNILIYITQYITTPFLGTYQVNDLGFSMTFVAMLSMLYSGVRITASFFLGSYADKKGFASMMQICICLMGLAFAVNIFTVPANGKIMYAIYHSIYAIAMGGLNSGSSNLVFDYVPLEKRSSALALYSSVSGLAGFLTTLAISPLVAHIQASGNQFLGMNVYAQQVTSAVSAVMAVLLIIYVKKAVLGIKITRAVDGAQA